jgi:hypothetical protein
MSTSPTPSDAFAPRECWHRFEALAGERVRASDATWAGALSPAERLAVADDLFVTVRDVRLAAGDWQQVEDRAWEATLAARIREITAFRRLDEATRGSSPLAHPG